jgi:hypothetical protein
MGRTPAVDEVVGAANSSGFRSGMDQLSKRVARTWWQRRRLPGPMAGGWSDGAGSQGHAGLDPCPPRQPPPL